MDSATEATKENMPLERQQLLEKLINWSCEQKHENSWNVKYNLLSEYDKYGFNLNDETIYKNVKIGNCT